MTDTKWPFFTRSGKVINLKLIARYDIDPFDIAWSLSNLARWNGQSREFYSVAQHCCHAYDLAKFSDTPQAASYALLHDALEAYIGDITKPVRLQIEGALGGELSDLETRVENAILARFGLQKPSDKVVEEVAKIDHVLLMAEARDLIQGSDRVHKWLRTRVAEYFNETDDKYQLLNIPTIAPMSRLEARGAWTDRMEEWFVDE